MAKESKEEEKSEEEVEEPVEASEAVPEKKTVLYEDKEGGLKPSLPIPDYEQSDIPPPMTEGQENHLEELGQMMDQIKQMKVMGSSMSDQDRRQQAEDMIKKISGIMDLDDD